MTLSSMIWRRFKAPVEHALVLEKTLDLNPHLKRLGLVMPQGTVVDLYIPTQEELNQINQQELRIFGEVE